MHLISLLVAVTALLTTIITAAPTPGNMPSIPLSLPTAKYIRGFFDLRGIDETTELELRLNYQRSLFVVVSVSFFVGRCIFTLALMC